jgi:hypothetical protein
LNIEQGERITTTEIVGKEEIQELGTDIRFIKTTTDDVRKKQSHIITTTGFWIASTVPFVLLVGLLGWKRRNDKLHGNITLLRYQKAQKVAKNRLKLARKLLDSQNHGAFYNELSLALFGYLEDKLHISKSKFTIDKAGDELIIRGVSDELIDNLKNSAEKCEFVRFAPGAGESAAKKDLYNELADVIINLEKSIGERKYV